VTRTRSVSVCAAPDFPATAARWIAGEISAALAQRGTCALALSGGHTPKPVYEALAGGTPAGPVDWGRVEVFFADERGVPPDHPDSNYRLAAETLLERVRLPRAQVHRMPAERADRDAAAREYERLLPDALDLLLLGMGPDGHTASLFPRAPALGERERRVVPSTAPFPPAPRLTITPPVIARARRVAVLVAGGDKAAMVARALEGPHTPEEVPVQLAAEASWFLDEAAAAALSARGRR